MNLNSVLVIDDHPDIVELIADHFDGRCRVFTAYSAKEGLKAAVST